MSRFFFIAVASDSFRNGYVIVFVSFRFKFTQVSFISSLLSLVFKKKVHPPNVFVHPKVDSNTGTSYLHSQQSQIIHKVEKIVIFLFISALIRIIVNNNEFDEQMRIN